ncbi:unnamed protein product [Ambrosiozyma monospora]|uniref:Unnamed protein product n=1 Tax=Ambrosiozyma monospora TaxID=43982 RepID=A0ACB5T6Y0_AMBMO|nr:unnamed protein product [Ambrosiozyma monospora]
MTEYKLKCITVRVLSNSNTTNFETYNMLKKLNKFSKSSKDKDKEKEKDNNQHQHKGSKRLSSISHSLQNSTTNSKPSSNGSTSKFSSTGTSSTTATATTSTTANTSTTTASSPPPSSSNKATTTAKNGTLSNLDSMKVELSHLEMSNTQEEDDPIDPELEFKVINEDDPELPYGDGSEKIYGFENFGYTCYTASIIQVLYHTPEFRREVLSFPKRDPNHPRRRKLKVPGVKPHSFTASFQQHQLNQGNGDGSGENGANGSSSQSSSGAGSGMGGKYMRNFFGGGSSNNNSNNNNSNNNNSNIHRATFPI